MDRRDQQIALASALGGGFVDTSNADQSARVASTTKTSAAAAQ
jgi:hypothetical protein